MSFMDFKQQYITTALWSSTDNSEPNGGYPLDKNYTQFDIAPETLMQMLDDCTRFYEANSHILVENDDSRAGHDFWLSRNGHGAGYFDGDWPEHGDTLQEASRAFGTYDLYIGDDGKIYGMGG